MADFEDISQEALAAVTERTARAEQRRLRAVSARYDRRSRSVVIRLSNDVAMSFPLSMLPGLQDAKDEDLTRLRIEGGGFGLHAPALDADIFIPQLLEDHLGTTAMRRAFTRSAASRTNGRLGGRPKKEKAA